MAAAAMMPVIMIFVFMAAKASSPESMDQADNHPPAVVLQLAGQRSAPSGEPQGEVAYHSQRRATRLSVAALCSCRCASLPIHRAAGFSDAPSCFARDRDAV